MATYIKTLKEDNGDITYPQTKAGAVLLNNGSDLETELSQYVTAEDIASTSALTPPVQTNMIADGAVTPDKIDWTTFSMYNGETSPVSVGTDYVTLKEFTVEKDGNYIIWASGYRSGNSTDGAIVAMRFLKNQTVINYASAPTVANYAGNHEVITHGMAAFSASTGDTVSIVVKKDRTQFSSNIGCRYIFAEIA